jgi:hypothetical protein
MRRNCPSRSVTSMSPLGSQAMDHGWFKPCTKVWVWKAQQGAANMSSNGAASQARAGQIMENMFTPVCRVVRS